MAGRRKVDVAHSFSYQNLRHEPDSPLVEFTDEIGSLHDISTVDATELRVNSPSATVCKIARNYELFAMECTNAR